MGFLTPWLAFLWTSQALLRVGSGGGGGGGGGAAATSDCDASAGAADAAGCELLLML